MNIYGRPGMRAFLLALCLSLLPSCARLRGGEAGSHVEAEEAMEVAAAEVREAVNVSRALDQPTPPEATRRVGMLYEVWFPPQPWDDAWARPELGYYDSSDREIIRKHSDWLSAAGVDFVWIDWSNNVGGEETPELQLIEEATAVLFDEYTRYGRTLLISILVGLANNPENLSNGNLQRKVDQIYDQFVARSSYRDLLVFHEGKPLLAVYAGSPTQWQEGLPPWDDERFTVRWVTGFLDQQPDLLQSDNTIRHGYWSLWSRYPQPAALKESAPEAIAVTAAHPGYSGWGSIGTQGRRGGETFREQWHRAREVDPRFVLINSWNEWLPPEEEDVEFSNDLEPSEVFGRDYLDLLAEEISAWKEVGP